MAAGGPAAEAVADESEEFGAAEGFGTPENFLLPADGIDLRKAVVAFEMSLIDQALSRTGGNKNQASQLLGMNRTTLVEKLRKRTTGR